MSIGITDYTTISKLPLILDSNAFCFYCGKPLIRESVETDRFDPILGNPYKFLIKFCPDWRPWLFGSKHMGGRIPTIGEELART